MAIFFCKYMKTIIYSLIVFCTTLSAQTLQCSSMLSLYLPAQEGYTLLAHQDEHRPPYYFGADYIRRKLDFQLNVFITYLDSTTIDLEGFGKTGCMFGNFTKKDTTTMFGKTAFRFFGAHCNYSKPFNPEGQDDDYNITIYVPLDTRRYMMIRAHYFSEDAAALPALEHEALRVIGEMNLVEKKSATQR